MRTAGELTADNNQDKQTGERPASCRCIEERSGVVPAPESTRCCLADEPDRVSKCRASINNSPPAVNLPPNPPIPGIVEKRAVREAGKRTIPWVARPANCSLRCRGLRKKGDSGERERHVNKWRGRLIGLSRGSRVLILKGNASVQGCFAYLRLSTAQFDVNWNSAPALGKFHTRPSKASLPFPTSCTRSSNRLSQYQCINWLEIAVELSIPRSHPRR